MPGKKVRNFKKARIKKFFKCNFFSRINIELQTNLCCFQLRIRTALLMYCITKLWKLNYAVNSPWTVQSVFGTFWHPSLLISYFYYYLYSCTLLMVLSSKIIIWMFIADCIDRILCISFRTTGATDRYWVFCVCCNMSSNISNELVLAWDVKVNGNL